MKNLLLTILTIIFFTSCGESYLEKEARFKNTGVKSLPEDPSQFTNNSGEYKIIVIDSCEYITGWCGINRGGPFMTHKGNCKNSIHKNK